MPKTGVKGVADGHDEPQARVLTGPLWALMSRPPTVGRRRRKADGRAARLEPAA